MKAAIFDMDGVVVDNHEYHYQAWLEFSRRYNFELNKEIYRERFNGKTNPDLFRMLFGTVSDHKIKALTNEKEGLYKELYFPDMKPMTGLLDFFEVLKKKGIRIALGTSAPPMNVDFVLDHLKLRQYFEVIVDGTMVSKGKPDPEVYRLCCDKLGLNPSDCTVFEDSLAGLESGERAGCRIVAVATSHQPFELKVKTENIIFDFTEARKYL